MARSKKYRDLLIQSLRDPEEAVAYLNAVVEEYKKGDPESQKLLLIALKNIALAQGGYTLLSKKAGLGRESLYKTLSSRGNPRLSTLTTLVQAMGFDLKFSLPVKH
jgi:probable addiction module antidote protein